MTMKIEEAKKQIQDILKNPGARLWAEEITALQTLLAKLTEQENKHTEIIAGYQQEISCLQVKLTEQEAYLSKIASKDKSITYADKGHFCEAKKELQGVIDIAKNYFKPKAQLAKPEVGVDSIAKFIRKWCTSRSGVPTTREDIFVMSTPLAQLLLNNFHITHRSQP